MPYGKYIRKKGIHGVYIRTKEIRDKISKSLTGRKQSKETILKRSLKLKGRTISKEHREKIRKANLGRVSPLRGIPRTDEVKRKISKANKGPNNFNWKGGISKVHESIRDTLEMKIWRSKVFQRDNYTCVICKVRGGELNADHIKPLAIFPELAYDVNNGRTLCKECHLKTDTWGSKTNKLKYGSMYKKS